MSAENVETVRRATEAFMRLDLEEWASLAGESIRLYPRPEEPGVEPFYEGLEAIGTYLGNWYSGWQEYLVEPVEYLDAGEFTIVDLRETGIAKGSGIRIEENFAHALRVEDGKITEWRMFGSVAEARAAVQPA